MTLMQAAKKAAEWMRWWTAQIECDCEDADHRCGLTERRRELEEIESAIKVHEPQERKSADA